MSAIHIRPFERDDAGPFFEAAIDSIQEVHPWLPWCHPLYTLSEAEAWVSMARSTWRARTQFQFVILSEDDEILGGCGLDKLNEEHKFANLGYWVRSWATRSGVATEAVQAVRDWAYENTDLNRLEIVVAVSNVASARVAEKAGAIFEGTLRNRINLHGESHDAFVYSFARDDRVEPGATA